MKPEFKKKIKENKNLCCVCKKNPSAGEFKGLTICLACRLKIMLEDTPKYVPV